MPEDNCPSQLEALIALYNATDGDNWTDHTNWPGSGTINANQLNSMDPCDPAAPWFGITCDGNGNITEINLNANGLNGVIPPDLARLTEE